MRYVTVAEMKEIDRHAIEECGIPALKLMENAGMAVAGETKKIISAGEAIIFAGYGNNGGDGLVAARHLLRDGRKVEVVFVGKPKSLSFESNSNLELLLQLKVQPKFIQKESDLIKIFEKEVPGTFCIIDAIFGIGIKGKLDDFYIELINTINAVGVPIISVDIPSGLDTDSGNPMPVAIKAHTTVTFGYPKIGFKNYDSFNDCKKKNNVIHVSFIRKGEPS